MVESPQPYLERAYAPGDLGALLAIEAEAGFAAWPPAFLRKVLRQPALRTRVVTAASTPDAPIGFYVLEERVGSVYLMNLAVATAWRRRAVGSFALERIAEWSRSRRARRIELHVAESNLGAQLLYKRHGFVAVKIVRSHYRGQDAYAMRKELEL